MKKLLLSFCFFVFSLGGSNVVLGQLSNYTFSAVNGSFSYVTGYTQPGTLSGGTWDDGYYNSIPIGFTFNYNGTNYTTLSASTNGWVVLGTTLSASTNTNNLTSGGTRPLLAPLWDDLAMSNSGWFRYVTTGSSPNRIFTIEFYHEEWNYTASEGITFQIKLYETTNIIDFVYQQEAGAVASGSASIGITATATGSGNFWSLNGTGASPTASSSVETNTLNTKPANGQIYRWTPGAPCTPPAAVTVSPASTTQCGGTVALTASGGAGGTIYWQNTTSGGTSTADATNPKTVSASGTYYFRSYNSASGGCWGTEGSAVVTINAAPAITSQPANASVTAQAGTANFTVAATGTGLTYQWQEYITSWNNVVNGGVYSGATAATLTITNPPIGMNGYKYRCVVSGTCAPSATSDGNATLTVTYCLPTYSLGCSNTVDYVNRVRIGTLDNTPAGTGVGTANCAARYVDYTGVAAPTLSKGTSYNLLITVGSDAGNYTAAWFDFNKDGDFSDAGEYFNGGNPGSNGTATISVPIPVGAASGITRMRIRGGEDSDINSQSHACGASPSGYGEAEDYNINICSISITTQPNNSSICNGGNTSFTIAASGASTYQWQVSTDGGSTWNNIANGGVYSNVTTTTMNITGATTGMNSYQYRCVATNGCSANSNGATLTVSSASVGGTASASSNSVCSGNTVVLTLAGYTGSIQWQSSPAGCGSWSNIAGATTTPYTTAAITATTCFRAVVTNGACSSANSSSTTVSIVTCYLQPAAGGVATYTTCAGNFYDDGGQGGSSTNNAANNYSHSNNNSVLTFYPSVAGNVVQVAFSVFLTEAGFDYLYIYNGNTTSPSSLIGTYDGSTSPGTVTSCAADGSLTFKFYVDGAQNRTGWEATVSCVAAGSTTNTWDGSSSAAWGTPANWSLNTVPTFCHNIVIPDASTTPFDPLVSSAVSVNNLTIQNGGILQADAAITVGGTFAINNGGYYIHNNSANPKTTIFNGVENFGASSTFEIRDWPGISTYIHNGSTVVGDPMHSTPFGNLTLDWNAGGFQWEWRGYMTNASNPRILGTLYINYTGTNDIHIAGNGNETHQVGALRIGAGGGRIVFKAQSDGFVTSYGPTTFNILGDITIEGGNFWLDEDGETSASYVNTVNIYGNYIQTGGTFDLCYGAENFTDAIHVVNLYGNYTQTGGTIESSHTGTGASTYYMEWHFAKAGTQTYSNTSAAANKGLGLQVYHIVNAGSTLQLTTDFACQTLDNNNQTFWILGTVDAGGYRIYPNNTSSLTYDYHGVYMASGSRLKTTNVNGFFTNGSATPTVFDNANNTTSFLFDANSTIEYNGTAQQILTNGGATPLNYAILDVNNTTAGGAALTMTAGNVSCEQLRLRDGVVSTGANTLTVLNSTAGTSGSIQNHSIASYINTGSSGNLRRYVASTGSYDFPVGNGNTDAYQLMNINITSGNTATYFDVRFDNPANYLGTGLPLTDAGLYQYDAILNNGGINPTTGNANGGVWTVTPNAGTANYNVSLYGRNYNNAGADAHTVLKRTTAGPGAWTLNGTYSSSTLTSPITAVRSGLSGFSQFSIGRSNVGFPVTLLEFSGKCDNNSNLLNWSTASESNNDFFTIEKSSDAQLFSFLGTVQGAGNSSTIKTYSLTDYDPLQGKTFYRLSQTDFDGTKETFAPILVSCEEDNSFDITVNSNPVTDGTIYLSISAEEGENILLVLRDILGREVYSKQIVAPSGSFIANVTPESNLAQGLYVITASSNDKSISRKIVVK